ncbi:MAG TPA: hypothetical protein VK400_02390 [Pyrinomonadaceae bacterium]|nr:hypothetical protein [Pyrinomonadaceae bacterium]
MKRKQDKLTGTQKKIATTEKLKEKRNKKLNFVCKDCNLVYEPSVDHHCVKRKGKGRKLKKSKSGKLTKSISKRTTLSYRCNFCNIDLSTKENLIVHQAKIHFEEVKIICENCNLVYAQGTNHQKYCTRRKVITRKR